MDKKHYNELVLLSQEIYDMATNKLTDYCVKTYGSTPDDTFENQLEDYLFIAEETSAYLLGNVLALMNPVSQETEIKTFVENLHRVIAYAQTKMNDDKRLN